jgi:hypothetical protein
MKMSVEHWWNDNDGGKQKYWEKSQYHSENHNLTWTGLWSKAEIR